MEQHKALKILALVIIVAAIVPAVIFGEVRHVQGVSGGDWWRNILLDFQTLFGGLLAVFAAWWTVDTMDRTDRAADRRHNHLVRLQTRSDKLTIERFLIRHLPALRALDQALTEITVGAAEVSDPCALRDTRSSDLEYLHRKLVRVSAIPSDAMCDEARPLFGGHLTEELDLFFAQLETLDSTVQVARAFRTEQEKHDPNFILNARMAETWRYEEERDRVRIALLPVHLHEAYSTAGVVLSRLTELAQIYEIELG